MPGIAPSGSSDKSEPSNPPSRLPGLNAIHRSQKRETPLNGRDPVIVLCVLEIVRIRYEGGFMEERKDNFVYLPLLTISESAKYLGVGRKMIYQLIENGEILAVKDGGSVRVEKKSLDDFRASGKIT
jgi:excisionase family DNA binding protein